MTIAQHDTVVERINDAVHRIELPLPLDDLHIVNAYAIVGDTGISLVDPGWSSPESEDALVVALATLGAERNDVRRSLVTHGHPDHLTQAIAWQHEHGIPVHLGVDEAPSVIAFDPTSPRFPRQAELLERAGAPELAAIIRDLPLEPHEAAMAYGAPDAWVADQEVIDCEGQAVRVHATPGHTRGHVVYEHVASGAYFTGDHVLPGITPAIALELLPEELPLAHYLASLELMLRLPDGPMLPAHGPVTDSVHARAQALLAHHEDRFARIVALRESGLSTAFEIASAMTWRSNGRALTALNDVHQMIAVIEVLSHLDVLDLRA
ncbi:MAG TPA: MBL fold metallo-hydrolase [Marmoricola sp.]|jgi:glyoxylase-like metal-dependent hydrolase (beta-lactamase superfamily II)|nr:MBL fold metallo-hydrolase [Marmoricola sp.]